MPSRICRRAGTGPYLFTGLIIATSILLLAYVIGFCLSNAPILLCRMFFR
jgi:hypothetical protein